MTIQYTPGSLVSARGREWIVISSQPPLLTLRPLAGGEETIIHTQVEQLEPAEFAPPDSKKDIGHYASARLLSDAVRLKLKDGAGAFRSMGRLSFEPRSYQYVPLLLALQQSTVRLLIADDVGIGKTIEAGMIAAELLARRDINRIAVLCPPHLCDQWQGELKDKFNIEAENVTAARAPSLERKIPHGDNLFSYYPYTVVSLDFIKSERRRNEFIETCPEFVIIDEAHTRVWRGGRHQGYQLLQGLAQDANRHMVFLTATPHSGDDNGFFNLLALLDEKFSQLKEATDNKRRQLRDQLGKHFVQRMRNDITNENDSKLFPTREPKEKAYIAENTPYGQFIIDVLAYCRQAAQASENRMNHWSMLALMRCVSSSPHAAEVTLKNRLSTDPTITNEQIDEEELKRYIMDGEDEDSSSDLSPPLVIDPAALQNDKLNQLAEQAKQIADKGDDPKFKTLCDELKSLLEKNKNTIVFCRYIATANYLARHLKGKFNKCTIDVITGEIPPNARAKQIEEIGTADQRILIATDCLSEGINLQDYFDSVIHYDLSWNPTRHQQREGRVDRLGQRSKVVNTCMIYGRDNPVDGAVLQVILRKAEIIRRELGVYVPLPDDAESMTAALLKAVLLRANQDTQLSLFSELEESKKIEEVWQQAITAARNKRSTIFAQNRIRPEQIIPETKEIVEKLGDSTTAQRFVYAALSCRGITIKQDKATSNSNPSTFTVQYDSQDHPDLEPWLPSGKSTISFDLPAAPKALYLHRAHPMVRHLAELFFESALLPTPKETTSSVPKHAYRAGAYFSNEVEQVTTIVIIRMRHRLHTNKGDIQLAEETAVVRIDGVSNPTFSEDEGVLLLLDAEPAANIEENRRETEVEHAIKRIERLQQKFNALAEQRAQELRTAYERVRQGVVRKSNITAIEKAETSLPPDIIGVYVVLPYSGGNITIP